MRLPDGTRSTLDPRAAVAAGSAVYYEVWRDDTFTGRKFTSMFSAKRYADAVGGTVRRT